MWEGGEIEDSLGLLVGILVLTFPGWSAACSFLLYLVGKLTA